MVNTNWVLFLYIYIDLAIHSICKNTALTKSNITENNLSGATNSGFRRKYHNNKNKCNYGTKVK